MNDCTIVTSLYSEKQMTQAGVVYLVTALKNASFSPIVKDLSSSVDYFNSPPELYSDYNSKNWLNVDSIKKGNWIDSYLPSPKDFSNIVFFSSLFSPDLVFHSKLSYNLRQFNSNSIRILGGCAISTLTKVQINFLSHFFDYILIGNDIVSLIQVVVEGDNQIPSKCVVTKKIGTPLFKPDYSLMPIKKLVTVYSGHGCYYGKCRFCDYPSRSYQKIVYREPKDVAKDLKQIFRIKSDVEDIVLTLDCYTSKYLIDTAREIMLLGGNIPYNIMLRGEKWISDEVGEILKKSGCTDVFIGAEAFDDEILRILNKGVDFKDILHAIKTLSKYVDVTIGMILFVPGVSKPSLENQLHNIKKALPYLNSIEPEVLTVVQGSEFALNPVKFGINLNQTENLLNDSWCYGLSQDIPWSMKDNELRIEWFKFTVELKKICFNYVKQDYWEAIDALNVGTFC